MKKNIYEKMPQMLYADSEGRIYEHPHLRMAGMSGRKLMPVHSKDLIPVPEFSKLFFIPDCPPVGLDPSTGDFKVAPEIEVNGRKVDCFAVATFLEPGIVRGLLPAVDYGPKSYLLPTWAYTAVGYREDRYWAAGFRVEYNHRWDPRNYDDEALIPAIERYQRDHTCGALVDHLINCAANNHCFAAKNLFFQRWEAPIAVSRACNAACLGCLSLQASRSFKSSHQRITFRPGREEIVSLALGHLVKAPEAIVSFGQGCEGEPLTEYRLIAESISEIRRKTDRGTINLNTNGSWPGRIEEIAKSGLDSIRISLNSARPEYYHAYFRPKAYDFEDVKASLALSVGLGLYTMINYLVFPGITDQEEEITSLVALIKKTRIHFLHLKNLNIDPCLYLDHLPLTSSQGVGMEEMVGRLKDECQDLELGYFNQAVR